MDAHHDDIPWECESSPNQSYTIWFTSLCGKCTNTDAFFNYDLMFNTPIPDITTCFEYTALVWLPVAVIFIACPLSLMLDNGVSFFNGCGKSSRLKIIKRIMLIILLTMDITATLMVTFTSGLRHDRLMLLSSVLRALTTVFVYMFTNWIFRKGFHTSSVLLFYWGILCVCDGIRVAANYIGAIDKIGLHYTSPGLLRLLPWEFGVEGLLLLLHLPADKGAIRPTHIQHTASEKTKLITESQQQESVKTCPQLTTNCLSDITFAWLWKMVFRGLKRPLTFEDVYDVRPEDSSEFLQSRFIRHWTRLTTRSKQLRGGRAALVLAWAVVCSCWDSLLPGLIVLTLQTLSSLIYPLILCAVMWFVEDDNAYMWQGYLILLALVVLDLSNVIYAQWSARLNYICGMRIRVMLTNAIYRKTLQLPSWSVEVGNITNLMSVDAYRMQDTIAWMWYILVVPITVPVATYFLWKLMGPSAVVGILWYGLVLPVFLALSGKLIKSLKANQMKLKDARIRLTNQVFAGIKVLKFYAWEPAFERRILDIQLKELKLQRNSSSLIGVNQALFFSSAYIASLFMFAVYLYNTGLDSPPVTVAFASITLLNTMQYPLLMLPVAVTVFVQACVFFQRLSDFLLREELNIEVVNRDMNLSDALVMQDCDAAWDGDGVILKSINLRVARGSLVAVVGPVGSGKSSLISAFLGEMKILKGSVNVGGSLAYVPQQAWIQNLNLKDNILFGKPYAKDQYQKVIECCCLVDDFKILPGGDLTEIGEKGINLSGGQNQRISLARACYQDNDIYVLDDPLSAVDVHVGRHIFNNVIGPNGMLHRKTRLMVTNALTYMDKTDFIVVLDQGGIRESGTFAELLSHEGPFATLLQEYLIKKVKEYQTEDEADEETDNEIEFHKRSLSSLSLSDSDFSVKGSMSGSSEERVPKTARWRKNIKHKSREHALNVKEVWQSGSMTFSTVKTFAQAASLSWVLFVTFGLALSVVGNVSACMWLSVWASYQPPIFIYSETGTADHVTHSGLIIYALIVIVFLVGVLMVSVGTPLGIVRALQILHQDLLSNALKLPMSFFDTTPRGRILNRFTKDLDTLEDNFGWVMNMYWLRLAAMLSTIVAVGRTTPFFLLIVAITMCLFVALQRVFLTVGRQLKRMESVQRSPLFAHFSETLSGLGLIRTYQQQQRFLENSNRLLDNTTKSFFLVDASNRWLCVNGGILSCCLVLSVALLAILGRGTLEAGSVGMALMYALMLNSQASGMLRSSCDLENVMVSVERISEYINAPTEAPHQIPQYAPPSDWPSKGDIEFKNLEMRYRPGMDLVLKNISCRIQSGEKVGIVGRTGAGKSSMTLALFRFVEAAAGSITIDGLNLATLGLHDVRGNLTIIPQEAVVFSGSIRENIDPFGRYDDIQLWDALEHSHLKPFVVDLGDGLEFECGEDGNRMSVGQRQLLCLARAFLRNPRVLILDETTAAIDLSTDELIQQTIRREFKSTTILTIAHRLQTIMDYDRILVMDHGCVIEFDTPKNLLRNSCSIFYAMARHAHLI